jgi:putative ABC transport system permease protein
MALGAERLDLIGMVLQQGLLRAAVGIGAGLLGAFALVRLLAGLVYGVSVHDPMSFGVAASVLAVGALLAHYLPARRSTKLDPAAVLREE